MDGKKVKEIADLQPSVAYALDLRELPAGMYLLTFESGVEMVTEKIIKK
jgi:hypothetical protein